MDKIFDLVQQLFDFWSLVWEFLWSLIQDLIYVVKLLPEVVSKIPDLFTVFLPQPIFSLLAMFITITVIYRILGRD